MTEHTDPIQDFINLLADNGKWGVECLDDATPIYCMALADALPMLSDQADDVIASAAQEARAWYSRHGPDLFRKHNSYYSDEAFRGRCIYLILKYLESVGDAEANIPTKLQQDILNAEDTEPI